MTDEEALKAREVELLENLNFFLQNYRTLLVSGFRQKTLDEEIELLRLELEKIRKLI